MPGDENGAAADEDRKVADLIAQGRLDYYLALPRDVLLHVLASRSMLSAWGDLTFGILAFLFTGRFSLPEIALWLMASMCSAAVLVSSFSIFGCLSFWLGNASQLAMQANNAILTLAMYPRDIFEGAVRFLMLTIIPAAFVGAIPLDIVRRLDWTALLGLIAFAFGITLFMRLVFYAGLRRYESGSALNVNV